MFALLDPQNERTAKKKGKKSRLDEGQNCYFYFYSLSLERPRLVFEALQQQQTWPVNLCTFQKDSLCDNSNCFYHLMETLLFSTDDIETKVSSFLFTSIVCFIHSKKA